MMEWIGDMSIYQKYELLELKKDDGVKTFLAKHIASGRPVLAHLFVTPGSPDQRALLKLVDELQENERKRILERGETDGTPFLITDRLIDYPSLRDWLNVNATGRAKHSAVSTLEAPSAPDASKPMAAAGAWTVGNSPGSPPPSRKNADEEFEALFATPAEPKPPSTRSASVKRKAAS